MSDARAMQSLAEAHRRELLALAGSRRVSRQNVRRSSGPSTTQRSDAGLPVTGARAVRRPVAHRFGAWLIELGTKLGGASVRTS